MRLSKGEKIFQVINYLFMLLLCFIAIYPLWYTLIASFSDPVAVATGVVKFWPKGLEFAAYKRVLGESDIWISYGNTVFYSIVGTLASMILTTLGAYALSKQRLYGRRVINFIIMISMWFGAGMMPMFRNFNELGLYDTRLAIILCGTINTFYVILLRTFFENVEQSMEESAKIDGASDWCILRNIYLPLSKPAVVAIALYYFVGRWNSYFWSMLLLKDQNKIPLQVVLRRLIVEVSFNINNAVDTSANNMTEQTFIYATVVIAVIPMLILYPFIQKFFTKGIMVGAIKG